MEETLSFTGKRWQMRGDDHAAHDTDAFIEALLIRRGIAPPRASWSDPTRYADAPKAAERVHAAVAKSETVAIFGDYDCDGITGTAQMMRFFRRRRLEPLVRLPHRIEDGYGLKPVHIDAFRAAGATLVISIDTGVTAFDALSRAKECGMDVIILDHHRALEYPDAFAVIHPHFTQDAFTDDAPSAAGVVFSFVEALEGPRWHERETDLVLAAIGTVADLVSLTGMNRALVQEGLAAAGRLPPGSLKELLKHVCPNGNIKSTDIAYRIAPRINAAGRMESPMLALSAILEGGTLLHQLESLNASRQAETMRCIDHALHAITARYGATQLPACLCVADETYPHGILGLIAGKLTERFGRPSMAANISGDVCTASLRSIPSYNITAALERNRTMLTSFGGHAQAAGCTFGVTHLEQLIDALNADAHDSLKDNDLVPMLGVDAVVHATVIDRALCEKISVLEPFGQGNPEPLLLVPHATITGARTVGAEGKHLQGMVGMNKLIGFGLGNLMTHADKPVDLLCKVGLEQWNGRVSPQLYVQDMRISAGIPARV